MVRNLNIDEEVYKALDVLCLRLRELGLVTEAERLAFRLHKVAWTTSSELFEEVAEQLKSLIEGPNVEKMDNETRRDVEKCLAAISNK